MLKILTIKAMIQLHFRKHLILVCICWNYLGAVLYSLRERLAMFSMYLSGGAFYIAK